MPLFQSSRELAETFVKVSLSTHLSKSGAANLRREGDSLIQKTLHKSRKIIKKNSISREWKFPYSARHLNESINGLKTPNIYQN